MDFRQIVDASSATDDFKHDLRAFAASGHAERIVVTRRVPHVKVLRVLCQLLSAEPEVEVSAVRVNAFSGCSDFVGMIDVESPEGIRRFQFAWDCAWRAEQEGWVDCFGFPDQIRAAREFGWRCFRDWQEVNALEDDARLAPV
jgi:hypothetical protein